MKIFIPLLSFLFITLGYQNSTLAQVNYPYPSGVYCSCGPTTGTGSGSVNPSIAALPFVKGILVRVGWDLMEPTEGNYNWTLIDGQISAAKAAGKKISLGIGCGISTPHWVFTSGAAQLVTTVPYKDTIPVPWDTVFLTRWGNFIEALGLRYSADTTIQLVYMTHSTGNGYEMQLPFSCSPTLASAGYTDKKVIDAWKLIIGKFGMAFPHHYLTNDFHPVNGSNAVADSVYTWAIKELGFRYGANAWWFTQNNTAVYASQFNILKNSASTGHFTGVQLAYNGTTDSAKFGPGGMPAALSMAISHSICYWELWNQDLLNSNFDSLLNAIKCESLTGITDQSSKNEIHLYPNPASETVRIEFNKPFSGNLVIFNPEGKVIFTQQVNESLITSIETDEFRNGIYYVRIQSDKGGEISFRKFRIDHY